MWNGTGDLNLMMFAGKEVRLLTILYKKHSLAVLRSALRVVSPVESSNWRYAAWCGITAEVSNLN